MSSSSVISHALHTHHEHEQWTCASDEVLTMGNDGGSIPLRSELVKLKRAPKKVHETATANNEHAWKYCALSRAPLHEPLASDGLGRLYNKESIIQYMLDREAFGDVSKTVPHIQSMKDIVELNIAKSADKFICEVTRRDMNGQTKFIYLVPCGHVFAADALATIQTRECLICSKVYKEEDIVPLNPAPKETEALVERLKTLQQAGLSHSGAPVKQKKKRKAGDREEVTSTAPVKKALLAAEESVPARSAVLNSLLHKSDQRVAVDGFMTRGTSSRVG